MAEDDSCPDLNAPFGERLEADERASLLHLQDYLFAEWLRQARGGTARTRRQHRVVGAVQCHFVGAGLAPQHAEFEDDLGVRNQRKALRGCLRRLEIAALLLFERRATQLECVLQSFFDFHVEPAVDTAVDELRRKVEHDEQRKYGEPDEHADHARLELGAGDIATIVLGQPREIADKHRDQQHAARDVDCDDDLLETIEVIRFLDGLRQQEQRRHCKADTGRCNDDIESAFQRSSNHSNHSLSNCHRPRQKNRMRSAAGYCCMLSITRVRMR